MVMVLIKWNQADNLLWVIICDTVGRTVVFCLVAYVYWIICIGKEEAKQREHVAIARGSTRSQTVHAKRPHAQLEAHISATSRSIIEAHISASSHRSINGKLTQETEELNLEEPRAPLSLPVLPPQLLNSTPQIVDGTEYEVSLKSPNSFASSSSYPKTIIHEDSFVDVAFSDEEEMGEEERLY